MTLSETLRTEIIPTIPRYYRKDDEDEKLDFKAIACFCALGFFLDDDTYFKNTKNLRSATDYQFDHKGRIISANPNFTWFYEPRSISFQEVVEEFTFIFEGLIKKTIQGEKVILPISGGLDSRTLAAALQEYPNTHAYSYSFKNGVNENLYGSSIARACSFPFHGFSIQEGYLWPIIEQVAQINGCYADFTNPRQAAVLSQVKDFGDTFLLGHWGDVLFDDMSASFSRDFQSQVTLIKRKILKSRGVELAEALWQAWGLSGTFENYFDERVMSLLEGIQIDHPDARVRAFKSMHWATRWTSSNLTLFTANHKTFVPYFHDEICKFICTVPEEYLADRQIQIAYLIQKAPKLASLPWQKYHPCNLYNYENYYSTKYLPYRAVRKMINKGKELFGKKIIDSNWKLQFLGNENSQELQKWLFRNSSFTELISPNLVRSFYEKFKKEATQYHHVINMLLTLSLFSKLRQKSNGGKEYYN